MAATAITSDDISSSGYNLTDSTDFNTLSTGSGNGVIFDYNSNNVIILKNDTGGAATFTFKLKTFTQLSELSITPSDFTIAVATGKTYLVKLAEAWKDANGKVTIECDVAGKVLVANIG